MPPTTKQKRPRVVPRPAAVVAEAVAIVCQDCGHVFPSPTGSEFWTVDEYDAHFQLLRRKRCGLCPSCSRPIFFPRTYFATIPTSERKASP